LPDLIVLQSRFATTLGSTPSVTVTLPLPSLYDALLTAGMIAGTQS